MNMNVIISKDTTNGIVIKLTAMVTMKSTNITIKLITNECEKMN